MADPAPSGKPSGSFFQELKRRHVVRVGVAYAATAWLLLQLGSVLFPALGSPDWAIRLLFGFLILGFPVALVLAWAFQLTPEGLRRETGSETDGSRRYSLEKKFNLLIAGAVAAGLLVFAVTHDWHTGTEEVEPGQIRSIVVLPLENLMGDPAQGYFVEGMHDALITELSKVKALRVISRTSSMHYQGSGESVPEIARELGVDAVVEGSVLKAGDKVRVTAQLIEAPTDRHIWSYTFDSELGDILKLYADVTRAIVDHIKVTVTPAEQASLAVSDSVDPQVYELYLKGRYLCRKWGPEEMRQSVDLLQQATELDPRDAPSQALLAQCLVDAAFFEYMLPVEIESRARAAALAAVQTNDRLAEAHVALGAVRYYLDYDPKSAEQEYLKALELNPKSTDALLHISWLYAESGRFDDARGPTRLAVELDPLSAVAANAMGQIYYLSRDFDRAAEEFRSAVELDRGDPSLNYYLASALLEKGQTDAAITSFKSAVELSKGAPLYLAALGHAYGVAGMKEQATQVLTQLQHSAYASPYNLAIVYLGLGRYEEAVDWLEQAYETRSGHLVYVNQGPVFDPLRKDQRFLGLLTRMGYRAGPGD